MDQCRPGWSCSPSSRPRRRLRDRAHAGGVLSGKCSRRRFTGTAVVLAIPAGGVPVAAVIARRLGLPLDLPVVSKVPLPGDTEAGYGAVAYDCTGAAQRAARRRARSRARETVAAGVAVRSEKVERRVRTLRVGRPLPDLTAVPAHSRRRRPGLGLHDAGRGRGPAAWRCRRVCTSPSPLGISRPWKPWRPSSTPGRPNVRGGRSFAVRRRRTGAGRTCPRRRCARTDPGSGEAAATARWDRCRGSMFPSANGDRGGSVPQSPNPPFSKGGSKLPFPRGGINKAGGPSPVQGAGLEGWTWACQRLDPRAQCGVAQGGEAAEDFPDREVRGDQDAGREFGREVAVARGALLVDQVASARRRSG